MADQHNSDIPNAANVIADDLVDIKENLEFHKDCFQAITTGWANDSTAALRIFPQNTVVLFGNKDAPTGWSKKTDWDDGAMIVIGSDADGTVLDSGGTIKPQLAHTHGAGSYVFPNHEHIFDSAGQLSSIDSQTGTINADTKGGRAFTSTSGGGSDTPYYFNTKTETDGGASVTGTSGDTTTAKLPLYQEVIACKKD